MLKLLIANNRKEDREMLYILERVEKKALWNHEGYSGKYTYIKMSVDV